MKSDTMKLITGNIISLWISWYFFEMPREILFGWRNFLWFGLNFFSLPLLLKSLFAPWKGISWSYGRGFDISRYFSVFVSNLISRFIGAAVRTFMILIGFVFEIFIFLFGILIFLGWFILPLLLILAILVGFILFLT